MRGKFDQAKSYFGQALTIDPKDPDARQGWEFASYQASKQRPSYLNVSPQQSQAIADAAIDVGTTFLSKEYPIGAPVVSRVLHLINDFYPAYQRPAQ
jgi:hypothetical protein